MELMEESMRKLRRLLYIIRHPYKTCWDRWRDYNSIKNPFGKEPQNTYYVIRCNLPGCGLFAIFMYILDHLAYAEDHGYIPILDSKRYKCLYKEKKPVNGTKDFWKYYFQPISEIEVKDCWKYRNIILGRIRAPRYKGIYYYAEKEKNVLPSTEQIDELYNLVDKYIKFRPELQEDLNKQLKVLEGKRVLGIHVRGTDMYTAGKQHPVPTGETKDFSIIDKILDEYKLDEIFLCTDTDSTVELFKEYYGEKVITTNALRQKDDSGCGVHTDMELGKNRENNRYMLGVEVITDMYLLAHCNVLMCGASKVAYAAMVYNHNCYDKIFYFV